MHATTKNETQSNFVSSAAYIKKLTFGKKNVHSTFFLTFNHFFPRVEVKKNEKSVDKQIWWKMQSSFSFKENKYWMESPDACKETETSMISNPQDRIDKKKKNWI